MLLLMRVGLNVCVLDSLGLLELAKFHQVAKNKQEFIFPQRWRPEVQSQGVSRAASEGSGEVSFFTSSRLWLL